jgi:hypothetical protein
MVDGAVRKRKSPNMGHRRDDPVSLLQPSRGDGALDDVH